MTTAFAINVDSIVRGARVHARFCIALLMAALVSGCTIQVACNLQNNSGSDLSIIRSRAGEQEQLIHVKVGSSVLLHDWLFWEYRVTKGDKVLRYVAQNPGYDFVVTQGFGPWTKRIFNAQIDPEGRIFVLRPEQTFPAKDFIEQPRGFPLVPVVE